MGNDPCNSQVETSSRRMILMYVLLLILFQPSQPFTFPKNEEEENSRPFLKPVPETRDYDSENLGGWFGLFVRQKEANEFNDSKEINSWSEQLGLIFRAKEDEKNVEIKDVQNVPVISTEWIKIYKEMIEELTKFDKMLRDSKFPADVISSYNASFHQLKELKHLLENEFETNFITRFHKTTQTLAEGKELFMSYDWYEKYSDALTRLEKVKNLVDNSLNKEITVIANKLSELRKSWEKFSLYNILQEQYKRLSWNSSLAEELSSWKSSLPTVSSYEDLVTKYLPNMRTSEPVCTSTVLTCPDYRQTFTADACCSPLWLSVGSPLGLGNECWVDLDKMAEQCSIFSCYGNLVNGTFNTTDGCTYIPDILLNYESCVIHDLCYVTPGVTKAGCDSVLQDNINKIYCDNVNIYERKLCSVRASLAASALEWTDKYFVAAGLERETCQIADSWVTRIWKYSLNRMFRPVF